MNDKLRHVLNEYNWDDGFAVPKELLENSDCDLALALEIFYLADGYSYLLGTKERTGLTEWNLFVEKLYNDIIKGRYIRSVSGYKNPLTKVQKYKLEKQQIPDIFITDI